MSTVLSQPKVRPLRIGEIAERAGRSVHAIRWYEAQGLIPGVMRDPGGRRVYQERHLGWLELIDRLRSTGMSIAQIRDYAVLVAQGRGTLKQQHALLRAHRGRICTALEEWTLALELLNEKIAFLEEWLATGRRPGQKLAATRRASSADRRIRARGRTD